jgi:hypothetical protein
MTAATRLDTQRQLGKNSLFTEQSENVIENKGSAWKGSEQSRNLYEKNVVSYRCRNVIENTGSYC